MKQVLIVDDEQIFLKSLIEGLSVYNNDFQVFTALNGLDALEVLNSQNIDLVVTDLKMPEMDGFELLAHMNRDYSNIPIIVMTAFGTPEIEEKTESFGAIQYLEKPLSFADLADRIFDGLAAGTKGHIQGVSVAMFLQLVGMENKTCTLTIKTRHKTGRLYILKGELIDAEYDELTGKEAALHIVCWQDTEIEIANICKKKKNRINAPVSYILMEGCRLQDENITDNSPQKKHRDNQPEPKKEEPHVPQQITKKEVNIMAVQDKLREFATIDGFAGVALFTPKGENMAILQSNNSTLNIKQLGVLANNVLLNAQKASLEMGAGKGQLVHVQAEKAHIIVRCLNEGSDPVNTEPGKAHIHLVLALSDDTSIGLAKMKIDSIIASLAAEFRH